MVPWSMIYVSLFAAIIGYELGMEIVRDVFVDEGSSVMLNCTCKREYATTWVGPRKSTTLTKKGKKYLIPYTEGCDLNPILKGTNINIICNTATGEHNLEVTNVSSVDEGSYKCLNSGWTFRLFNIFVKIPPKADVAYTLTNGTLKLECSLSGVPNNYTFLQLEHRSEFNEHIRFLNFSFDGYVLRTSIEEVGLQDSGIYVCNVSNDEPDQNGRQFRWGKTLIELEDAPVFLHGDIIRYVKFGEVIGISAVVYNRHNVTETEIHRITPIQSKGNVLKLKTNITNVKVHKNFYGSNVTLNASLVFFQLDIMKQKDFTIYNLKMCNLFGCRDIKIDIRIDTSRILGNAESQHRLLESVFATVAVLSVLGIGMTVASLIRQKVKDEGKRQIRRIEDSDEDTPRQSVAKELYQSPEFLNSDNLQHLLKATESGGYVYYATTSTSLNKK